MKALLDSCPVSNRSHLLFTKAIFPLLMTAACAMALAPAAAAQSLTTFAATAVGTTTPATETVTVSLQSAGTVAKVEVVTLGAPNLDFTESGTDNCVGISSGSCTVTVAFAPKYPGQRNGAVVLLGAGNNTLGTAYLSGIGQGSLGVMVPGSVSILAGQVGEWTMVNDGGPATQADLYLPSGVAVDGTENLYIADSHHNRIREVIAAGASAGTITTVAGDGSAGYDATATVAISTSLNQPGGVAIDGAGNLYIADTNNNVIREVNLTTGSIATVAGTGAPGYTGDGGAATAATLNSPEGIAVDAAGDLYIADTDNNAVREVIAATGKIATIAGDGTGVPGFSGDAGLAIHAKLDAPYAVALDYAGNLYVADSGNNRVRQVNTAGNINTYAGNGTPAYLGDGGAATSAELYSPLGVACDPAGNVYIADARNYVVRKVNAVSGVITTIAGTNADDDYIDGKSDFSYGNGQSGDAFSGGGIATGAGIYAPYGIAVDASGNLLIAEYFDHLIRKVNADAATLFFSPELWQNQVSSPENQKVENDGNEALTFSAIAPDPNAAVASSGTTCSASSSVAVDAQCVVAAEFAPTSTANPLPNPLVGNVNLVGNPADSPLDISIVGEALGLNGAVVTLSSSLNPAPYGQTVTLNVSVKQDPNSTKGTPTGTVTFSDTFQGTTNPLGTAQTLNSSGNASLQLTTLAVGTHVITANYSGDTYYSAAASNPLSQVVQEQVTVTVASSSSNDTSAYGSTVIFTATVAVSGGIPVSGSVSFYNGATYMGSGTLSGSGVATYTTATLPVGANPITASYTDTNNVTATSSVLTQTVEQNTATSITSNVNPSIHGTPVTFTAVVVATGTTVPTGTVTFYDGNTQIGTGTLTAAGTTTAVTTFQTSTLAAGSHSITASYGGDANDFSSTSAALAQTVNIASSTTALAASTNPSIAGITLTLTATVTTNGGTAAGTVNFYNGTTVLGAGTLNGVGVATLTTSTLPVGSHSITAGYQGDANDTGSTSAALSLTVTQATTAVKLASSAPSVVVSTPVTLTATVTGNGGAPTGNVTFMDGTNTLGSVAVNGSGVAAYTTSSLTVGTHTITAVYGGDANDAGSTSAALTETVTAYGTQTSLAASSTSLNTDQELTLLTTTTTTSGGAVTGTITYMSGTTTLGSATVGVNGTATLTINPPAGSYSITAHYSGDALNAPSVSNAVTVTVSQATEFTIALNPTNLSIPTTQSAALTINLGSQDGFTDKIALGCGSLPYSVTCNFATNDITLNSNGQASVQLTVDTNSPLASGSQSKNEMPFSGNGVLACMFPGAALFGFAFWRFRKNAAALRVLAVLAMLTGTTFLMAGCGGFTTNSAKPGSYVIQVTATGEQTGVTHVANLTVTVTQ
ncbi:MAG: Ig-like domain repeat protein [Acidobacteriaceae bacterium]